MPRKTPTHKEHLLVNLLDMNSKLLSQFSQTNSSTRMKFNHSSHNLFSNHHSSTCNSSLSLFNLSHSSHSYPSNKFYSRLHTLNKEQVVSCSHLSSSTTKITWFSSSHSCTQINHRLLLHTKTTQPKKPLSGKWLLLVWLITVSLNLVNLTSSRTIQYSTVPA
jgi:hypothetical protein